jgi:hypothetical protein
VLEIFSTSPWLVAIGEIALVPLIAIVWISLCVFTRKVRLARYDYELKRDMLQRGMSAEEIRIVIEAGRPAFAAAEGCRTEWSDRSAHAVESHASPS